MSCKSITCCERNDYSYVPGNLPTAAPVATIADGSCDCPPIINPRVTCLLMQVMDGVEYHKVCLVDDGGVFTLEIDQSPYEITDLPQVTCLLMRVVGLSEYHEVCLVEDAGIFTLNIDQSASTSVDFPRITCLIMQVVGSDDYHQVCLVEDAGIFTLEVDQSPL